MKTDIHPPYAEATVSCSCGNSFTTRSTKSEVRVEICSNCHPFYTGKQKFVDTGGRLERFQKKLDRTGSGEASTNRKKARGGTRSTPLQPAMDPKALQAKTARAAAEARKAADDRKAADEAAKAAAKEAAATASAAPAPVAEAPVEVPLEETAAPAPVEVPVEETPDTAAADGVEG